MDFLWNMNMCGLDELKAFYLSHMKPVVIREALFADCTQDYVKIDDKEDGYRIQLRLRTAKNNVEKVYAFVNKNGSFTISEACRMSGSPIMIFG